MNKELDPLIRWAGETSEGLMFLGTQIVEEEDCLKKIDHGIDLCDMLENVNHDEIRSHQDAIDVNMYMVMQEIKGSESSANYRIFKKFIKDIKEAKAFLIKVRKDPKKHHGNIDEYRLYFSRLSRLLAGI